MNKSADSGTQLCVVYDSNLFSHRADLRQLSSNLAQTPAVLRQLNSETMDLGFGIRSRRTGKVQFFSLKIMHRDENGIIVYWLFTPVDPSQALEGYTAVVFNTLDETQPHDFR